MNIYVDANWNGTDAAPEGYDAIYKTIAEAVTAVSEANKVAGKTDIGATITVASGTYSDNIYFRTTDFKESDAYGAFTTMNQTGDIVIQAVDGADVIVSGTWFLGERINRNDASVDEWNAELTINGITFDSTSVNDGYGNVHTPNIKKVSFEDCTFTGAGYGVNSRGSSPSTVSFENCTVRNCVSPNGNVSFENCEFMDCLDSEGNIIDYGHVNIQTSNGTTVNNCSFNVTVTATEVDGFYVIRNNNGATIDITNTSATISAEAGLTLPDSLSETPAFIVRRGSAADKTSWELQDVEINLVDGAENIVNVSWDKKAADTLIIDNLSSSSNDVADLLNKTQGDLTATIDGTTYEMKDGEVQSMTVANQLAVSADVANLNAGDKIVIGGCTYIVGETAFDTITKAFNVAKTSTEKVTIEIAKGEYTEKFDLTNNLANKKYVVDGVTYAGGITFKAVDDANVQINGYFQCNSPSYDIKDIVFDGLTISNNVRNGGYFAPIMFGDNYAGKTASGIVINNCNLNSTAVNGTSSGVALGMGLVCDGIVISNNTVNADCGVYGGDGNLISNTVISGNTMNGNAEVPSYNYWAMVFIYNNGAGNVITDNTISGSALNAIKINKGEGAVFTDNVITDCQGVKVSNGSVVSGNTVDGEAFTYPMYEGEAVIVIAGLAGNEGDVVVINGAGYTIGTNVYSSIASATAEGHNKLSIASNITESIASLGGIELYSLDGKKYTITNTYDNYLYYSGDAIIGENLTFDNYKGYFFSYGDNVIDGDVKVYCPYTRYDGTLTINGSMTFKEQFVIRYADDAEKPLITINGDAKVGAAEADRKAQLISDSGYMSFYSGTISASNTLVYGGHLQMTQTTDGNASEAYSNTPAILDLNNTIWYFASNDINSAELTGKAVINATNKSVLNFNDKLILGSIDTTLNVTDSIVNVAKGGITNNGTILIDGQSILKADTLTMGENAIIKIDATNFTGFKKIIDLTNGTSLEGKVEIIGEDKLAQNVIYGEDGDITLVNIDTNTIYVSEDFTGNLGDEVGGENSGIYLGYNAFGLPMPADVADAIRAASADANVSKVVVDENSTTEVYSHAVNYNITTQNANGLIIDLGQHTADSEVESSLYFGGETTTIGEKVQVIADGLAASTGCTSIKGALDINEAFIFAGGEVSVAGQLNVNNDFVLSGTFGSTDKLTVEKDGLFTATNLVVQGTNFEVNINGQANIQNLGANSIVNIGETGSLDTTINNGTLNVAGTISGKEVTNNNIINVTSSTAQIDTTITGNGIFAVKDGAEFTTSKDIIAGSVFVGYDYETEEDTAGSTLTVAKNTTLKATGEEGVINVRANSKLITNGDVVANYFRATGDIEINGQFALEGSSSSVIKKGATVVVNGQLINQYTQDANGVVTSYPVSIDNAGTLDVNGKISLAGKVDEYDSFIANSGVININKNANIDAIITGNGAIAIKDGANFTANKDISADRVYVGYDLTTNKDTAASSLTIAKDATLSADSEGIYVRQGSSVVVDGTLKAALLNLDGNLTINGNAVIDGASTAGSVLNGAVTTINGSLSNAVRSGEFASDFVVEKSGSLVIAGGKFDWSAKGANNSVGSVQNAGTITISGETQILAAFTGNAVMVAKNAVLTNSYISAELALKGAITINASSISGTITGNQVINVKGDTVLNLSENSVVKAITIDGKVGFLTNDTKLGSITINGKTGSELTANANIFAGNKVSKVTLYLTDVNYANIIALDIDNLANIKSINNNTVYGNATAGYTFNAGENEGWYQITEVNNQLIFTLISETETVTRENITGSLDNLVVGNDIIVTKEGTANLTLSKDETAKVAAILKNENGSKSNLTIDKKAQLTVANDVEAINKLTTKDEATLTIGGTLTGTHENTNITIGKNNTINVGSIDLMGGKNTLSIASGAEVNITASDLVDATTIKLANGIAANAKKGTPEDKTVLDIAGNIENSGAKNTITLGNLAELNVAGELDNSDLSVGTTIKAGKNSTITFGGAMKSVASINLGEASELSAQSIIGTVGNDKFVFGKNSVVNVDDTVDMKGGKNTFQASANAKVDIAGSLDNATTVKVDKNATLFANGNITGVNKLTLGNEAILKAQDIVGTDKKDTLSISANAKLIVTSINDIESINIAKGGLLILQNGNADINLDSVSGSWKNGTIYDYQYNITDKFNGDSLDIEGAVYKNEFDCYQFMVEAGGISQIAFDSDLTGINLSLWKKIDDQWTQIDYFKGTGNSTPIYDSSILSAGNYLIMVSKENADLLKDNANDDNTYSITITK